MTHITLECLKGGMSPSITWFSQLHVNRKKVKSPTWWENHIMSLVELSSACKHSLWVSRMKVTPSSFSSHILKRDWLCSINIRHNARHNGKTNNTHSKMHQGIIFKQCCFGFGHNFFKPVNLFSLKVGLLIIDHDCHCITSNWASSDRPLQHSLLYRCYLGKWSPHCSYVIDLTQTNKPPHSIAHLATENWHLDRLRLTPSHQKLKSQF